jgi:nitrate/nitrite transporter NarK
MQAGSYEWSLSGSSSRAPYPARGPLFVAVLFLHMLGDAAVLSAFVVGAGYLARPGRFGGIISDEIAHTGHNAFLFLALLLAVELGFLTGVWMGKKWGALGYVLLSAATCLVASRASEGAWLVAPGGWNGLFALVIVSKWKSFE